ncbi:MAG TPA: molybdopterin-guanine dinucleotide biosynthesis protein B [Syntrophomonadaceae bacterium]|nr:molybdopterin-guanine dinucleotide biosynthesis protein B [Syntrophomonadaceae bacterium]
MVPIIAFAGRHDAGKTTLLTKIIAELNKQGIGVGVIKNAHHKLEIPNAKDSERLFNAGALMAHTFGEDMQITYTRLKNKSLNDVIKEMQANVDIIILEGHKESEYPKVEVMRREIDEKLLPITNVIARVLDFDLEVEPKIELFGFEEIDKITNFIIKFIEDYEK